MIVGCSCCFFFFQAEDGIRDLVRSRGLGDVYKRQVLDYASPTLNFPEAIHPLTGGGVIGDGHHGWAAAETVSYTHLTLPTSDLV